MYIAYVRFKCTAHMLWPDHLNLACSRPDKCVHLVLLCMRFGASHYEVYHDSKGSPSSYPQRIQVSSTLKECQWQNLLNTVNVEDQ